MTYQIIYSSESSMPMELEELEDILEQARSDNAMSGITGALVYVDGVFLQLLEGERGVAEKLMKRICKDVRHEKVTILKAEEMSSPAFTEWKMAYIGATPEQVARWAGLDRGTVLPEILNSMRQDPHRATQLAQSILSVLVAQPAAQNKAE